MSTAPASSPRRGLRNRRNRFWKAGTFPRPATAPDIVSMPNIRVAKPSRMVPVSCRLVFLPDIYRIMPIRARTGVKEEGFNSLTSTLPLSIPARLSSQAVTVVPMLAPMITLMACFRLIRPEFTKPTTITVAAEEL